MRLGTMHAAARSSLQTTVSFPSSTHFPCSCLAVGLTFDTGKQAVPAVVTNSRVRKQVPAWLLLVMCQVDGARLGTCMSAYDTYSFCSSQRISVPPISFFWSCLTVSVFVAGG